MVASFIDGRIRIREVAFINRSLAFDIQGALLENKGITRASVNRGAGSLLVNYDTTKVNGETVVGLIAGFLNAGECDRTECRRLQWSIAVTRCYELEGCEWPMPLSHREEGSRQ
jgi:hypothetical protein